MYAPDCPRASFGEQMCLPSGLYTCFLPKKITNLKVETVPGPVSLLDTSQNV